MQQMGVYEKQLPVLSYVYLRALNIKEIKFLKW